MIRRIATAVTAFAVLTAPAPSEADPGVESQVANYAASVAGPVCAVLADYPTLPGVEGILIGIKQDSGFTDVQSGEVIALAVQARCPRFTSLILRFADTWSGRYGGGTTV